MELLEIIIIALLVIILVIVLTGHIIVVTKPSPVPSPTPQPTPQPASIGGCAGTRYGCCPYSQAPKLNEIGSNCVKQ
jgi:hypothetical protein